MPLDQFLFANFTEGSRKALSLARKQAILWGSEFVGTEHLLMGIIQLGMLQPDCLSRKMLESLNLDARRIREEIEKIVSKSSAGTFSEGQLPFSPACRRSRDCSRRIQSSILRGECRARARSP